MPPDTGSSVNLDLLGIPHPTASGMDLIRLPRLRLWLASIEP
jgi:hypothetical protein